MQIEEIGPAHAREFLEFVADLRTRDTATFARWFDRDWNEASFAAYARACAAARLDWRPKTKQISTTTYVLRDEAGLVGVGWLRFPLEPAIERDGGNLAFVVAPARRGHGLGPVLLNRLLFEGARAGLARALVTCGPSEEAARRSILANRGVPAGLRGEREAFWIPLR